MKLYLSPNGILLNVIKYDSEIYKLLQTFYREKDTENIEIFSENLFHLVSQDIQDVQYFKEITVHAFEDGFSFVLHNGELNEMVIREICSSPGLHIKFSTTPQDFINNLPLTYSFYELPKLAQAMDFASLGGQVVSVEEHYYIKSDNLSYLDFLNKHDFITSYKTIIPDLHELVIDVPER